MANLTPYLTFRDTARQAMEFYQSVFGGELTTSTFAEFGASSDPAEADKIMHSQLETPEGVMLMAADTPASMDHTPGGAVSVALFGTDEQIAQQWAALSDGGTVTMPFEPAPWGDTFGMCTDRFGTQWLVNLSPRG